MQLFEDTVKFNGKSGQTIDGSGLEESSEAYSIAMWIKPTQAILKEKQPIMILSRGSSSEFYPEITLVKEKIRVRMTSTTGKTLTLLSECTVENTDYIHLVFSVMQHDITEATLFINGYVDSQLTVTQTIAAASGNVEIGKTQEGLGFVGTVLAPCWYFNSLSEEEVTKIYKDDVQTHEIPGHNTKQQQPVTASPQRAGMTSSTLKSVQEALSDLTSEQHPRLAQILNEQIKLRVITEALVQYSDWLIPLFDIASRSFHKNNKIVEINFVLLALKEISVKAAKTDFVYLCRQAGVVSGTTIDYMRLISALCEIYQEEMPEDSPETIAKFENYQDAEFHLCINFSVNLAQHQLSTRLTDEQFANLYNTAYQQIRNHFPNAVILGNKYGPPVLGRFSIFIEGVGEETRRDKQGRLYLFSKKFLEGPINERAYLDALYILIYTYGCSTDLAAHQQEWKQLQPEHANVVRGPYSAPKSPSKQTKPTVVSHKPDQEMWCTNWGCSNKVFINGKNFKTSCRHHPGRWEFGSTQGLWPECWTCCRGAWNSEGCVIGPHKGVANVNVQKLCVNRGAVNPYTGVPDSYCGCQFPDPNTIPGGFEPDPKECKIHLGYLEIISSRKKLWTCCGGEESKKFCTTSLHRFTDWPDDEAKIYFITKTHSIPRSGATATPRRTRQSTPKKGPKPDFSKKLATSRFFDKAVVPYGGGDPKRAYAEENPNTELRYCLNWACESVYRENQNSDNACQSHSGFFDFGEIKTQATSGQESKNMWESHWRCCGASWDTPGCRFTRHKGPLVAKMDERKWKWPSEGAKRYFQKKQSSEWKLRLQNETITRRQAAMEYQKQVMSVNAKKLPLSSLHPLCLTLHLHILSVGEDPSFTYKYQDMINGKAEAELDNGFGYIEKDTFVEWWFAPLEQIRPEMAEPENLK